MGILTIKFKKIPTFKFPATVSSVQQHGDDRRNTPKWRPPNDLGFIANWRCFLGLKEGRTFMRHILLPSSHGPIDKYVICRNDGGSFAV